MRLCQTRMIVGMVLLGASVFVVRGAVADPGTGAPEEPGAGAPAESTSSPAPSPRIGRDLRTVAPPRGGALEQERDPGMGPRAHEPVFFGPASTTTEHTRFGLSSWIAPGAPFDHREDPGGVAAGFTISWGAPKPDVPSSGPNPWRGSAAR
jgi:hypothetical protein